MSFCLFAIAYIHVVLNIRCEEQLIVHCMLAVCVAVTVVVVVVVQVLLLLLTIVYASLSTHRWVFSYRTFLYSQKIRVFRRQYHTQHKRSIFVFELLEYYKFYRETSSTLVPSIERDRFALLCAG